MFQLVFVMVIYAVYAAEDYNISHYGNPIIYEQIGSAYLYSNTWVTMHYIKINDLNKEINYINDHVDDLIIRCNNFENCTCTLSLKNLSFQSRALGDKINTLSLLNEASRNKRGLINFVGKGIKYLFGNMDDDDAEIIAKSFDKLYDDSGKTLKLVKNQTALVKNIVSQLEQYEAHFRNSIEELNNVSLNLNQLININRFNNILLENILVTKINMDRLEAVVVAIENSIQADKSNLISPTLITPRNFIDALELINDSTRGKSLFPVIYNNYHLFLKLSKIQIFIYKERLIYKIVTAIPNNIKYHIIKLTPIPVAMPGLLHTSYYIYNNLYDKEFALSDDKLDYMYTSSNECFKLHDTFYCEIQEPILRIKDNHCFNNIITNNIDNHCERKYFRINHNYVLKLKSKHTWYILPMQVLNFQINCRDKEYTVEIHNASLFTLNEFCTASSNELLLTSSHHVSTAKIQEHNIKIEHSQLERLYFEEKQIQLATIPSHLNLKEIKDSALSLEQTIAQYESDLAESRANSFTYYTLTTLQVLSYLSLFFLAMHILYKLGYLNCLFRPFRICFDNRPLAPRQQAYQTVNYATAPPEVSVHRSIQPNRHKPLQFA